jgi:hypothetical protein
MIDTLTINDSTFGNCCIDLFEPVVDLSPSQIKLQIRWQH